jgi:hypothetical protein
MHLEDKMREAAGVFRMAADQRAHAASSTRDTYADAVADFAACVVELMRRGR